MSTLVNFCLNNGRGIENEDELIIFDGESNGSFLFTITNQKCKGCRVLKPTHPRHTEVREM